MQKLINVKSKLVSKIQLNEVTYELKYEIPQGFVYKPGQFLVLLVTPPFRRSYSVCEVKDGLLTLLIDVKPMGVASKYFIDVNVGDETVLMGPYGQFFMNQTSHNKVFIATSTGIAPFLPMVAELKSGKALYKNTKVEFLYGSRYLKEDIAKPYLEKYIGDNFKYLPCITQPEDPDAVFYRGRVTEVFIDQNYDYKNTEFYICGGPAMVESMREILKTFGAEKVYFEKY